MPAIYETADYKRAIALEATLISRTGATRIDMLAKYRAWLDRNEIDAETNGWPSEDAYNPANIDRFIREWNS